jgi:hypothetical protein
MEAVPSHEQPKKAIDRLSDYGEVCFASHGTKAEFCRGAEADSIRYIADEWDHMFAPGVLLRVSGTVEHVTTDDMTSSLNEIIDGVYLAAKKCGAWVLTSGLGEGVAPLVGESIHQRAAARTFDKHDLDAATSSFSLPLIGVTAWGRVGGREQFSSKERGAENMRTRGFGWGLAARECTEKVDSSVMRWRNAMTRDRCGLRCCGGAGDGYSGALWSLCGVVGGFWNLCARVQCVSPV